MRSAVVCDLAPGAGGAAVAAALAVEAAVGRGRAALLVEVGPTARPLRSTLLSVPAAAELEAELCARGIDAAARGNMCRVAVRGGERDQVVEAVEAVRAAASGGVFAAIHLPGSLWRWGLAGGMLEPDLAVLCAARGAPRAVAALAASEARNVITAAAVWNRPPSRVAARRALAGLPSKAWGRRPAVLLDRAGIARTEAAAA